MTASDSHKTRTRWWVFGVGVLALVLVLGGSAWLKPWGGDDSSDKPVTFTVKQGPLTISVTESGTIKAREQEILKSEVEGQSTIIYLIPEGTLVKKGELLVELDASDLQDERVDQQIQVQNAEAAFIQAREDLEIAKSQAESDIAQAELDYRFAQEDVKQYQEGEYPKLLKEAESNITLAKEELERAAEKLKWSETLYEEKYISQTEFEADRLEKNRAQLNYELSVVTRDLLTNFTYDRQVAQLESDVDQTRMALDRVRRQSQADIVQAEAQKTAKELEFKQQKDKLQKLEDQLGKTKIVAPIDGMVIYATSAKGSWRGNDEPLDEGQVVREREELIYLPTTGAMMAEVKVHESNLDKVSPELPVQVTVDALPGSVFEGTVATIAPLPDAQSLWLNPDLKIYSTQIHLKGSVEGLRTGMTCRVEIIVEDYEDVTYVPIQSVLRIGGQPSVYVSTNGKAEARPVEIGLDNNRMIHIISGLEPGEAVLLKPPLAPSATPMETTARKRPATGRNGAKRPDTPDRPNRENTLQPGGDKNPDVKGPVPREGTRQPDGAGDPTAARTGDHRQRPRPEKDRPAKPEGGTRE